MPAVLDIFGKLLFVVGFLWVCCVGTAPDVPLHMVGLPLCGTGAVIVALAAWRSGRRPQSGAVPVLLVLVAVYFGCRAWASPVRHLAEMDMFLVAALVCGFSITWFSGRVRWMEPWIWLVAVAGAGMGLWQVFVDKRFTLLRPLGLLRPIEADRASGFFYNPNPFGAWCAMLLLLAGAAALGKRSGVVGRGFALLAGLGALAGLLPSYCRAAFLGAVVGFGVVVLASLAVAFGLRAAWWKKTLVVVGVMGLAWAGGIGVAQWLPKLVAKRSGAVATGTMMDTSGRQAYWHTGLSQFLDAPVAGTGSRTFSYLSYENWDKGLQAIDLDPVYVHSEYVQTLAEYGFAGLVVVACFVCGAMTVGFRRAVEIGRRDKTRAGRAKLAWCLGCLGAGAAFLSDVIFSFSGHFAPMILLLGVMTGGIAAIGRPGGRADEGDGGNRMQPAGWAVLAATLVSAVFLWFPGWAVGWTTCRMYVAKVAYEQGKMGPDEFLGLARGWAELSPRYPGFMFAGRFCSGYANCLPADAPRARELNAESLAWVERAMAGFPASVEARVLRAQVKEKLGLTGAADEDFRQAAEQAKSREYIYRVKMLHGEGLYQRAVAAWQQGNAGDACRLLVQAKAEYLESKKRAWVTPGESRWREGMQTVEDSIGFFKRTGIWVEPGGGMP